MPTPLLVTTMAGDADDEGIDLSRVPEVSVPPHARHLVFDADRCFRLADQAGSLRSQRMFAAVGSALLSLAETDEGKGGKASELRLQRALNAFFSNVATRWVDHSVFRRLVAALRARLSDLAEHANRAVAAVRRAARELRHVSRRAVASIRSFVRRTLLPSATVLRLVSSLTVAASAPPYASTV